MPTVDIDPDELRDLTGHDEKSDDDLIDDLFGLGLEFEGRTEDGEFELEFAPDRLDRLSVEGVARSMRYQYGDARGCTFLAELVGMDDRSRGIGPRRASVRHGRSRSRCRSGRGSPRVPHSTAGETPRDDGAQARAKGRSGFTI